MISSTIQRLNDRRTSEGESGADAGFTLIELMVVLLILAILLAIAIPTFLGVTKSANDRAAQSNLNTALTNVKSYFQNQGQTYGTTGAAAVTAAMSTQEPSVNWTTGASTSQNTVSVFVDAAASTASDGTGIILAVQSKNNSNCWYAFDNSGAQATTTADAPYNLWNTYTPSPTAIGTFYAVQKNASTCSAASIPTYVANNGVTVQQNSFPPSP
jgi:type IV pilus assembly protein PilA